MSEMKVKRFRKDVIGAFLRLFAGHAIVVFATAGTTNNFREAFYWQLVWFSVYFLICLFLYMFAPNICNKRFGRP